MIEDLLTIGLGILAAVIVWAFGVGVGQAIERRKNRRQNSAMADCAACEYQSGPQPLSDAARDAQAHRAATGHICLVVRA